MTNTEHYDVDRLIHFLEFEVESRQAAASRPGWTLWAIVAAISYLAWSFLALMDNNLKPDWISVYYIFYLFSLCFDLFLILIILIPNPNKNVLRYNKRLEPFNVQIGPFLFFVLIRQIALLYTTYYFSTHVSNFNTIVKISCFVFISLSVFQILLSQLMYHLNVPTPNTPNVKFLSKIIGYLFYLFGLLSGSISVFGLINIIYRKILLPSILDLRMGLIIFGISMLFLLIFMSKPKSILIMQLDNIRKNIVIGRMSLLEAREQTDIIIFGFKLNHVLQNIIKDIVALLNEMHMNFVDLNSELKIIEKYISDEKAEHNDEERTSMKAILRSIAGRVKYLKDSQNKLMKLKKKLHIKMAFYTGMNKDLNEDAIAIVDDLKRKENELSTEITRFSDRFDNIYKMIDEGDPDLHESAQQSLAL
jgi:hypothetical protein